jgi:hypothetical protein
LFVTSLFALSAAIRDALVPVTYRLKIGAAN